MKIVTLLTVLLLAPPAPPEPPPPPKKEAKVARNDTALAGFRIFYNFTTGKCEAIALSTHLTYGEDVIVQEEKEIKHYRVKLVIKDVECSLIEVKEGEKK